MQEQIKSVLFGLAVGDALGVPVEFLSRKTVAQNPVTDMLGFGTHNQPPGTFSDDASLAFCLAEALNQRYDTDLIGDYFVDWRYHNFWTAHGYVFDVGNATHKAIVRITTGVEAVKAGGSDAESNGNGSLMRIAPLLFEIRRLPLAERWERTRQVSSITHRHIRSVIACFYFLEFARLLLEGMDKFAAYQKLKQDLPAQLASFQVLKSEMDFYSRLLNDDIHLLPETAINSTGYVLHTLEASMWCILTTDSYEQAVLKAVNLGEDTDTTGAVTGALAGLLHGFDSIPKHWVEQMALKSEIEDLAMRFAARMTSSMRP